MLAIPDCIRWSWEALQKINIQRFNESDSRDQAEVGSRSVVDQKLERDETIKTPALTSRDVRRALQLRARQGQIRLPLEFYRQRQKELVQSSRSHPQRSRIGMPQGILPAMKKADKQTKIWKEP
jgi:hypothetical protein